jgi:hypothetical protein
MRRDTLAQRIEVIPAFERGDDPSIGMPIGEFDEAPGDPRIVVGDEA